MTSGTLFCIDIQRFAKMFLILYFLYSILSQIVRVGKEVLDFRKSIAEIMNRNKKLEQKENSHHHIDTIAEDPLFPLTPIKTPSKDVTPKELPDRYFMVPSPDPNFRQNHSKNHHKVGVDKSKNHHDPLAVDSKTASGGNIRPKILQNGFCKSKHHNQHNHQKPEAADNMSDNLSGVSMGTSSLSSDTVRLRNQIMKDLNIKTLQ